MRRLWLMQRGKAYEQKKCSDITITRQLWRAGCRYAQKGTCTSHHAVYACLYPMHLSKRGTTLAPGRENFPLTTAN